MNYTFILKFSSIQNLSDARYAAGMWADYTGFCFNPDSQDYIEQGKAREIMSWLSGPCLTGEFGHQPPEWIHDFIQNFKLGAIEIPADYPYPTESFSNVRLFVRVSDSMQNKLFAKADWLIADTQAVAESLKTMNWPVMVYANTLESLEGLEAVCFKCGREEKPGTSNQTAWTGLLEKYQD